MGKFAKKLSAASALATSVLIATAGVAVASDANNLTPVENEKIDQLQESHRVGSNPGSSTLYFKSDPDQFSTMANAFVNGNIGAYDQTRFATPTNGTNDQTTGFSTDVVFGPGGVWADFSGLSYTTWHGTGVPDSTTLVDTFYGWGANISFSLPAGMTIGASSNIAVDTNTFNGVKEIRNTYNGIRVRGALSHVSQDTSMKIVFANQPFGAVAS